MHGAQLEPIANGLPRQGKSAARALRSDELGFGSCTPIGTLRHLFSLTQAQRVSYRADHQDDWHDIPAQKTAWGTEGEHGWWEVALRATHDDRISVKLRGRMVKVSLQDRKVS